MTTASPQIPDQHREKNQRPDSLKHSGEHPAFGSSYASPPLEGERQCVCGHMEGEHRSDGSCEDSGCSWFLPWEDDETSPDVRIEYDAGEGHR